MNMKTPILTGLTVGLAMTTVAAGQGQFQLFDTTGIRSIDSSALTAQTLEGDLAWGSGFALDTPGKITYASGIEDISQQLWGPFAGGFTGEVLRDDFAKGNAEASGELTSFHFVGGVANAGQALAVFFLDTDENVVDGFQVTLPQGGNFIWTINLKGAGFEKPDSGFVQIQGVEGSEPTWLYTDSSGFLIGENVFDEGNESGDWEDTRYAFKMRNAVPAPGALALLGLAGLVGVRRRRS